MDVRRLALAGALVTAAVYAPSLAGDWVWDDWYQIADPTPFRDPWRLVTMDVWGALNDTPSDLYRPLPLLSHVPGQVLSPGPFVERLLSLLLHLGNAALVAFIARRVGASALAAWAASLLFALHPIASETVAWASARHDLLATTCLLGGWALVLDRRDLAAGVVLGLAPFCKESFLLTPLATGVFLLGVGRPARKALTGSVVGVAAYLGIRAALDLPLSAGRTDDLLGAFGAVGLRFAELLAVPTSPDAFAAFTSRPALGVAFALGGLVLVVLARGRAAVAVVAAPALLVAASASAAAFNGFLADRYYYVLWAGTAVAVGVLATATDPDREKRAVVAVALVAALLAPFTALRAMDWTSNAALYSSSLERDPSNPHAAWRAARDLHTRADDCAAAIPLYRVGIDADPRAGNNLQACLMNQADWEGAAAMGPDLMARDPANPTPAFNTAWSYAALGRFEEAKAVAQECLRRAPDHAKARDLVGRLDRKLSEQGGEVAP